MYKHRHYAMYTHDLIFLLFEKVFAFARSRLLSFAVTWFRLLSPSPALLLALSFSWFFSRSFARFLVLFLDLTLSLSLSPFLHSFLLHFTTTIFSSLNSLCVLKMEMRKREHEKEWMRTSNKLDMITFHMVENSIGLLTIVNGCDFLLFFFHFISLKLFNRIWSCFAEKYPRRENGSANKHNHK